MTPMTVTSPPASLPPAKPSHAYRLGLSAIACVARVRFKTYGWRAARCNADERLALARGDHPVLLGDYQQSCWAIEIDGHTHLTRATQNADLILPAFAAIAAKHDHGRATLVFSHADRRGTEIHTEILAVAEPLRTRTAVLTVTYEDAFTEVIEAHGGGGATRVPLFVHDSRVERLSATRLDTIRAAIAGGGVDGAHIPAGSDPDDPPFTWTLTRWTHPATMERPHAV